MTFYFHKVAYVHYLGEVEIFSCMSKEISSSLQHCKNYKNRSRFPKVMITNVLPPFFMVHSVYWNFYEDDVIIMTLCVNRTQSVCAVFYPFFHHLPSVKRYCEFYEYQKNECVQQWNLFKCQTSTFYFSTYCPNLFEHLLIHAGQTIWETRLLRSLDQSLKQHIGQVIFINNAFSSTSKFLTPNMYCWSCKTLVSIYWTHLRVNGILRRENE